VWVEHLWETTGCLVVAKHKGVAWLRVRNMPQGGAKPLAWVLAITLVMCPARCLLASLRKRNKDSAHVLLNSCILSAVGGCGVDGGRGGVCRSWPCYTRLFRRPCEPRRLWSVASCHPTAGKSGLPSTPRVFRRHGLVSRKGAEQIRTNVKRQELEACAFTVCRLQNPSPVRHLSCTVASACA
jgi:hypothetical protein